MDIKKNVSYACHVVRINNEEVNYLSSFELDDEYITRVTINEVERKVYDRIKKEIDVKIVIKYDLNYITIVECQLARTSYKNSMDNVENMVNLEYDSSLMLVDYFWSPSKVIGFSGIRCQITETTELLGVYPYQVQYDEETHPQVNCDIKGNLVSKQVGHGFSYFVEPSIVRENGELRISMHGVIQYDADREREIIEIRELIYGICLFFEVLAGEIITIDNIYLCQESNLVKAIGLCNYPKFKLNGLQSNLDHRAYLRKSIFKVSDFEENIGKAIAEFYKIQDECTLACEAYKQILLDEDIKISTYNKFLKVMQVVEGFQRARIGEEKEKEFTEKKKAIMEKLDKDDREFVSSYTVYNGQTFRKCIKDFTKESIKIISDLNGKKIKEISDDIINAIVNDRDVYTHASKQQKTRLSFEKLRAVSYCYKSFFRVLVLYKMGLSEQKIRSRLLFDRCFVAYYKMLFGLDIIKDNSNGDTGLFDKLMW